MATKLLTARQRVNWMGKQIEHKLLLKADGDPEGYRILSNAFVQAFAGPVSPEKLAAMQKDHPRKFRNRLGLVGANNMVAVNSYIIETICKCCPEFESCPEILRFPETEELDA